MEKKEEKGGGTLKGVLVIIDGFGYNPSEAGNAVFAAKTPNLDLLWSHYPHTLLKASEEEVGLAFGQIGNSEVGHMAIGSGRIIPSSYQRINGAIEDGGFAKNEALNSALKYAKENNVKVHVIGMISNAGVHADLGHMIEVLKVAAKGAVSNVWVHPILDGRDTGPREAKIYLEMLEKSLDQDHIGKIATISGRAYAMDRNQNWEKTKEYANALLGKISPVSKSVVGVVEDGYTSGLDDETIQPALLDGNGKINEGDVVVLTNFREDRMRQLTKELLETKNLHIVTMTEYEKGLPVSVMFTPLNIKNCFSDILANSRMRQLHIAETEKYAHVTYFFNGGREKQLPQENYVNITSDSPGEFLNNPAMKAREITKYVIDDIGRDGHDFVVINFANPDMIGHTGNFEKTKQAIEVIDECIGRLSDVVFSKNAFLFIVSDHGNSEQKVDAKTGQVSKDHTINPVPFIIAHKTLVNGGEIYKVTTKSEVTGILQDVAPTILTKLGISVPEEMTGAPLF